MAQTPRKISTARQPPNSGDSTVALKREPNIKPVAKPADITPEAKPNCPERNHSRLSLTKFIGSTGCTMPKKNDEKNSDQKSKANPRVAPKMPVARQRVTSVRRVPN